MFLWQTYWIDPEYPPQRLGARLWYYVNGQWVGGWTLHGEWAESAYLSGREDDLNELGNAVANQAATNRMDGAAILTFGTRQAPFRAAYDRLFWIPPEWKRAPHLARYGLPAPSTPVAAPRLS